MMPNKNGKKMTAKIKNPMKGMGRGKPVTGTKKVGPGGKKMMGGGTMRKRMKRGGKA
tara:strand:- start:349 stop:519 length:171 start_codon:yes stop_codon:yes gene_type:complete